MGNYYYYKDNPPIQKGEGNYLKNNISLGNKNNGNSIKKINIIKDNSINNKEIELDVILETLIRIFLFEKKIKELCNKEDNKNNESNCVIVSKILIDKYKEIFQFSHLKNLFDNNEIILKHINNIVSIEDIKNLVKEDIKKEKIKKEGILSKIIEELNKIDRKLVENIKVNQNLLSELNKLPKINCRFINTKKNIRKVLVDFEIINFEIFLLLIKQNISVSYFLFAEYFISFDKILILIKEYGDCSTNAICEVGKYNKNEQYINIEYLLDNEEINDSYDFKDKLKNIKISEIYQKISGVNNYKNEIQYIEYNFDLADNNLNKKITKEEAIISNEKKNEDIIIFKKNDLNLGAKINDENKLNKIGMDSDNIVNGENSKV